MSYTELLDRFWAMERDFSDKERLLYFYLLHRCNALGWPDTFSLSNEELIGALRCRPTAMRDARNGLVDAGLISFKARFGRGENSTFSITDANEEKVRNGNTFSGKGTEWEHLFNEEKVRNGNTFSKDDSSKSSDYENDASEKGTEWEPFYDAEKEKQNKKEKNNPPAPPIKKKKINKKKTPPKRVCVHTCESGQEEIVFKEVEQEAKERLGRRPEPPKPNLPGSLEDVIAFFEKNAADKLPDWKESAEAFFYHYESYGWNGTSNRKIVDWESKANLWICEKAIKHKQTKNNGVNSTNNARDESDRAAAELVERLLRENSR